MVAECGGAFAGVRENEGVTYQLGLSIVLLLAALTPVWGQLQPARVLIVIGPPGSGKTVQSDLLRKRYKIPAISVAQVLQKEVNRKSAQGKALAAALDSGELVMDAPANEIMRARLLQPDAGHGFILDGYPATEGQAKALDEFLTAQGFPKPTIIVLDIPEEVAEERLKKRGRADDKPGNIERRLRDYLEVGKMVEQWYGAERIVRIAGSGTPAEVAARIEEGIEAVRSRDGLKARPVEGEGLKKREAH